MLLSRARWRLHGSWMATAAGWIAAMLGVPACTAAEDDPRDPAAVLGSTVGTEAGLGTGAPSGTGTGAPSGTGIEAGARSEAGTGTQTGTVVGAGADSGAAGNQASDASREAARPTLPAMCHMELQCASTIPDDPKIDCTLKIADNAGASLYSDHAGVELRGRSSLGFPKRNYAVEFRTAAGVDNPVPMLGMGKESDWVFDGSWVDRSFMRNDLTFWLYRDTGRYAPESRYCTLSLNGSTQGIYRLCEKIKRDDDRVVLPDDDGSGSTFLITQDPKGPLSFVVMSSDSSDSSHWKPLYPKADTATSTQIATIQTWLSGLQSALSGPAAADERSGVFSYMDFDAAVDWILVEEFAKNIDGYFLSLYISRASGQRAIMIPWDIDLGYGQPTLKGETNEATSGWVYSRTKWINAFAASPALQRRLGPRWRALRTGPFSTDAILGKIDAMQSVLDEADLSSNFAKWPIADVDFAPYYDPYTLYRVSSYADEVSKVRAWIQGRLTWMDGHIDGYPN